MDKSSTPLQRLRAFLFTPARLPGWALVLYGAVTQIPDWNSRMDFWVWLFGSGSGLPHMIATVLSSPYFDFALIIAGGIYLYFVRGVVHIHHQPIHAESHPHASVGRVVHRADGGEEGTVTFKDAVLSLYESVEGKTLGQSVSSMNKTAAERLDYFANSLLLRKGRNDGRPVVRIYAKRSPSRVSRILSDDDLKNLHWDHNQNCLRSGFASEATVYSDVTVNNLDLDRHAAFLKELSERLGGSCI